MAFSPFSHKRICSWVEITDELHAEVCDDGETLMYRDVETGDVWFEGQRPPAKWQRYAKRHRLSGVLSAAAADGVCSPHPKVKPRPAAKIVRLQKALQGLAQRVGDKLVSTTADGLVGNHTVKAANRALYMYARGGAPSEFTSGGLTHTQIVAFASQLTAYIDRSPIEAATRSVPAPSAAAPPANATASIPVSYTQPDQSTQTVPINPPSGGVMNPQYYPPGYQPYYSNRGPGGLPADHPSVDVKAFIPAQYEHVQVDPTTVMVLILVGLGIYYVASNKKHHHKRED